MPSPSDSVTALLAARLRLLAREPSSNWSRMRSPSRAAWARATPLPRCRRAPGCRCRCARARSSTSSAIATSRWASRSMSGSGAATRAPRTSRAPRSSRRCAPPSTSPASPPRTRPPACPTLPTWRPATRPTRDLDLFHPWPIDAAEAAEIARRCEGGRVRDRPPHHQLRGRGRLGPAVALLRRQQPRFSRRLREFAPFAVGGADRLAARPRRRRHAARRLVQLDARAAGTRRARGGRPLRGRARAVAPEVAQDRHLRGAGAVRVVARLGPARRLRAGHQRRRRCTASRASCSTAWAQAVLPPHIDIFEDPHVPRAKGSAPFDDEGVLTRPRKVVERRRGAGLLPVDLLGAQARHAQHRARRRLAEPAPREPADRSPATTSTRCCASSAAACS